MEAQMHEKSACVKINSYCNLCCSYCLSHSNSGENWKFGHDLRSLIEFLKDIDNIGYEIDIGGGEPTCMPGIEDFLNELAPQVKVLRVMTNGSAGAKFEKSIDKRIQMVYTWHSGRMPIDKFFLDSDREDSQYRYFLHPDYIDSGKYEKDMKEFSKFRSVIVIPYLGFGTEELGASAKPGFYAPLKDENGGGGKMVRYYNYNDDIYYDKLNTYEHGKLVRANGYAPYSQKRKFIYVNHDGYIHVNYDDNISGGIICDPDWGMLLTMPAVSIIDAKTPRNGRYWWGKPTFHQDAVDTKEWT